MSYRVAIKVISATAPKVLDQQKLKSLEGDAKEEYLKEATASFKFNFPDTALEAIDQFGDELVNSKFQQRVIVEAQSAIRTMREAGKSAEEIKLYMEKNWKPGASMSDPTTSAINASKGMDPEARKAFLLQLQQVAGEVEE